MSEREELTSRAVLGAVCTVPHLRDNTGMTHTQATCPFLDRAHDVLEALPQTVETFRLAADFDDETSQWSYCGHCSHDIENDMDFMVGSVTAQLALASTGRQHLSSTDLTWVLSLQHSAMTRPDPYDVGLAEAAELLASVRARVHGRDGRPLTSVAVLPSRPPQGAPGDLVVDLYSSPLLAGGWSHNHLVTLHLLDEDLAERARACTATARAITTATFPAPLTAAQRELLAATFTPTSALGDLAAAAWAATT